MAERFQQFEGLVDDCALQRGVKVTTPSDLQGFWDMVAHQVDDLHAGFAGLETLQQSGWQEVKPSDVQPSNGPQRKVCCTTSTPSSLTLSNVSGVIHARCILQVVTFNPPEIICHVVEKSAKGKSCKDISKIKVLGI